MKGTFDYDANEKGELGFKTGDIIFVTQEDASGWFNGYCKGVFGMFPSNFAEPTSEPAGNPDSAPSSSNAPLKKKLCRATFDYEKNESNELGFKVGDIITVLSEDDSGWWTGELNGEEGMFPSNFVEVIDQPKPETVNASFSIANAAMAQKMKLKSASQSKPATPQGPQPGGGFNANLRKVSANPSSPPNQNNPAPRNPNRANAINAPKRPLNSSSSDSDSNSNSKWPSFLPEYSSFCEQLASILSSTKAEGSCEPSVVKPTKNSSISFVSLNGNVYCNEEAFAPIMEAAIIPLYSYLIDNLNDSPKMTYPSQSNEFLAELCATLASKSKSIEEKVDEVNDKTALLTGLPASVNANQYAFSKNSNISALLYVMAAKGCINDNNTSDASKALRLLTSVNTSTKSLATLAATLVNDGINPVSNEKAINSNHASTILKQIFNASILKDAKLPTFISRSGFVILAIPNVGGLCIYSPQMHPANPNSTTIKEVPPVARVSVQGSAAANEIFKKFNGFK